MTTPATVPLDLASLPTACLSPFLDEQGATTPSALLSSRSPTMHEALSLAERVAGASIPVLLRGESGTGKGVLAERIHLFSPRRHGPFVVVNCPALSDELLASELFGHARGAFTGAVRDKPGLVEAADGGTLFLDEIGDLSPSLQVKLLRFLQDKCFERLGEVRTRKAEVRIVAATNRDLERAVATDQFRLDLFYRLSVVDIRVPALRERREDLPALTDHLLRAAAKTHGARVPVLSSSARAALSNHPFPGNVRELKNELERAVVLCTDGVLNGEDFSERLRGPTSRTPIIGGAFSLDEVERAHVESVVARTPTLEAAASVLGIDGSTLWRKRRRYALGAFPLHRESPSTADCNAGGRRPLPGSHSDTACAVVNRETKLSGLIHASTEDV